MKDFKVISIDRFTRRVTLIPPFPPRAITGIEKLIQTVVLAILSTPGRNMFYVEQGSGLMSLIGDNFDPSDPSEMLSRISERVEKIREEIIENQNGLENENASERLADLQVASADTGVQIGEINVKLRLISEAGDQTSIVL